MTAPGTASIFGETDAGKRVVDNDVYDSFESAVAVLPEFIKKNGTRTGIVNYKAADESFLDVAKLEMFRLPRQKGIIQDLIDWWNKK